MSHTRIKNLFNQFKVLTLPAMAFSAGTAALGSTVLSKMGYENHDALSAAGMAALGSLPTLAIPFAKMNLFSFHKNVKDGGKLSYATAYLTTQVAALVAGASLFLLSGSKLEDIKNNSADLAVGSALIALPIASHAIAFAEKLINDFEAQQKKDDLSQAATCRSR